MILKLQEINNKVGNTFVGIIANNDYDYIGQKISKEMMFTALVKIETCLL